MMRTMTLIAALCIGATGSFGQGAIIEALEDLPRDPLPEFRASLPERVDISASLPPPRSQADTATCVSWAATYAAGSQAMRRAGLGDVTLSPAFTYNQVSGDQYCRTGTSASKTLDLLRDVGAMPMERFVFDGGWCGRKPTDAERQIADKFRIKGWRAFDGRT